VRAVVHKAIQHCGRLLLDPLEILASATHVNIDGADIHEDAVSKFTRKFSLHALQCMDASRRGSSRLQNSGMAAWIERWRIGNFGIRNPAQRFVCRADFSSDGRIMGVVEQATAIATPVITTVIQPPSANFSTNVTRRMLLVTRRPKQERAMQCSHLGSLRRARHQ
jgi:hypothetical protein